MGIDSNSARPEKSLVLNAFLESTRDFLEIDGSRPMVVFVRGHKALLPAMRAEVFEEIEGVASGEDKHIVFDFSELAALGVEWNWVLAQLAAVQRARGKKVAVTNASPALKKYLIAQGLDSALLIGENISVVCRSLGLEGACEAKKSVSVDLINPFLGSLIQVFEAQISRKPIAGTAYVREPGSQAMGDLCGVIEVNSPNLQGLVVFSFPKATIRNFVSAVHGAEDAGNPLFLKDSIGEITNIAFTRGKTELNAQGFGIKGALPSTFEREKLNESFPAYLGPSITVPFTSDLGDFFAEIRLAG